MLNSNTQTETLLHILERAAAGIDLHVNAHNSQLGLLNTSTASLKRGKTPTDANESQGYNIKPFVGEAIVMLELLGNVEYHSIAIAPKFTRASE